ncbi:Dihydroorotate dehydrogenase (NAD(+)), electron transfer subunit [hydrothermal vent metagenome]|uniref:Dihydroorotate dehydrogenase (NAD(+)), electron transfer subunit n=1 Tax=hydrothermal vent metagenome TaxID=652676 RepID=A0A3B1BYP4_9ZZZZ
MLQVDTTVESVQEIQKNIFLLKVSAPSIGAEAKPGQFCNIKVNDNSSPLLRRPFSICEVSADKISFMFNIVGLGTKILSKKKKGDRLNIIGPLGNGFNYEGNYKNALIVAGGIGAAPFPFMLQEIDVDKHVVCFIGGRTKDDLISYKMKNILTSTDDGSDGFHGNVVQLLKSKINEFDKSETKIFACGPTPMLRAVSEFSIKEGIECEVSTESVMACGFGICQGCVIKSSRENGFVLVCKDGPVFNAEDVKL